MNNAHLLKQFIKFLKTNNAYNDYIINFKRGLDYRLSYSKIKTKNDAEWIVQMIKVGPNRLTIDAFSWLTKDEHCWTDLHHKWKDYLDNYKKKNKL